MNLHTYLKPVVVNNPYENAIAERVNGVLKQEFDIDKYDTNLDIKGKLVRNAIDLMYYTDIG